MSGATLCTNEEFVSLRKRHDAYAEANINMNAQLNTLRDENKKLSIELAKLESQLTAEQTTLQMVVDDNGRRYDAANREVDRLRQLLKEHNIPIGG